MIQSNHDHDKHHDTLLQQVIMELQTLRMMEQQEQNEQQHRIITTTTKNHHIRDRGMKFPPACYQYILQYISGNQYCFDCQSKTNIPPTWANIHYGTLHCIQCSGIHRSYGVHISYIRSIQYDTFTYSQMIALLEGGNDQLYHFFHRHQLLPQQQQLQHDQCHTVSQTTTSKESLSSPSYKYHTNAALYYKMNLQYHIQNIIHHDTIYHGRQYNRNNQLLPPPSHIYIPNSTNIVSSPMDTITTTTTNDDDTVNKITPSMITPCRISNSSSNSSHEKLQYTPKTLRRSKSPNSVVVVVTDGIDSDIHHS